MSNGNNKNRNIFIRLGIDLSTENSHFSKYLREGYQEKFKEGFEANKIFSFEEFLIDLFNGKFKIDDKLLWTQTVKRNDSTSGEINIVSELMTVDKHSSHMEERCVFKLKEMQE